MFLKEFTQSDQPHQELVEGEEQVEALEPPLPSVDLRAHIVGEADLYTSFACKPPAYPAPFFSGAIFPWHRGEFGIAAHVSLSPPPSGDN